MILRRVMEHVKSQNWTAVAVDFLIVVVGVFIGIQLGNWNDARLDQRAYRDAMTRLAEETTENLHSAASLRTHISEMLSDVQPAIDVLRTCETGSNAEETVNNGLNTIRSARSAGAVTVAIDQLVENERLLNGQSDEVSALLRQFYSELHDINATAHFVQRAASAGRDEHPLIGFTGMIDPQTTFNGVDIRRAQLNVPLAEACKDQSFLKLFYNWERSHVYQLKLIRDLEAVITESVRSLNLADFNAKVVEHAK
jgi:hypothetical protein